MSDIREEEIIQQVKKRVSKLYVKSINSDNLSEEEQELAKAVHNDAIALVIDQLDGKLVKKLS